MESLDLLSWLHFAQDLHLCPYGVALRCLTVLLDASGDTIRGLGM